MFVHDFHQGYLKAPDALLLKGFVSVILGIMVAVFGKGRRTVALTIVAGTTTFALWALVLVAADV